MRGKIIRFLERINKISKETKKSYLLILLDYWSIRKKLNISFYEYYCFYLDKNKTLRETFLSKIIIILLLVISIYLICFLIPQPYKKVNCICIITPLFPQRILFVSMRNKFV